MWRGAAGNLLLLSASSAFSSFHVNLEVQFNNCIHKCGRGWASVSHKNYPRCKHRPLLERRRAAMSHHSHCVCNSCERTALSASSIRHWGSSFSGWTSTEQSRAERSHDCATTWLTLTAKPSFSAGAEGAQLVWFQLFTAAPGMPVLKSRQLVLTVAHFVLLFFFSFALTNIFSPGLTRLPPFLVLFGRPRTRHMRFFHATVRSRTWMQCFHQSA